MIPPPEMQTWSARLESFQNPHQLSKRRASSQAGRKKKDSAVEWPHTRPDPEELARAGFFYRPVHDSNDNVQCFLCAVKLDGWEATDDPIKEHVDHSSECAWATTISVRPPQNPGDALEDRDPLSEVMADARKATFTTGEGWPHENKKGWKCKTNKMVEAGWVWDPSAGEEGIDGVTCFYCNLTLDGWEPKDDPFVEHQRREPDCRFFQLLEQHYGTSDPAKLKKSKSRGKASIRGSTASKASRMSVQSAFSEAPSMAASLADGTLAGMDDSIVTTASQATTHGAAKGRKKAARPKAAAKGAKGKKKATSEPQEDDQAMVDYPVLTQSQSMPEPDFISSQVAAPEPPARATRNGTRASRQADSSVIEISQMDVAPPKKRGAKKKVEQQVQPEPELSYGPQTPDAAAISKKRESEVTAQLMDELELSMEDAQDESTPHIIQPQRGVKRTSDGLRKQSEARTSVLQYEFSVPPKAPTVAKRKQGRKAKKASEASTDEGLKDGPVLENPTQTEESQQKEAAPPKKKTKGGPKGKKASSARSPRPSRTSSVASGDEMRLHELEPPERNDAEIERELERIAAEQASQQAMQDEQDQGAEFEPSPFHERHSKGNVQMEALEREMEVDANVNQPPTPPQYQAKAGLTPSPSGSDKENQPSSTLLQSAKRAQPAITLSPTKTTRVPLAPGTPNRSLAKASHMSPSKQISHLTSSTPWAAVDIETALLPSPQPTPGRLGRQLVDAAGALTSPEKVMSVEDWVRYRAEQSEEQLRLRCEQMVGAFEKEGIRALESLGGIRVAV